MTPISLFFFALLVPLAFLAVLVRYRTGLMGLTLLNVVSVVSASLTGFLFDVTFGLPLYWFTSAHADVVRYSVVGCLAMATGVWLGWRPLATLRKKAQAEGSGYPPMPGWINPTLGWTIFTLGLAASAAYMALQTVPTLSTALYSLSSLMRLGLFVLLAVALWNRNWISLAIASILALPVLIVISVRSGHTPLPLNLILPLAFLAAFFRRVSPRSFLLVGVVGAAGLILMQTWMSTRGILRSGELENYGIVERSQIFLPAFTDQLSESSFEPAGVSATLLERIDMTELLAHQLLYQPDVEPYARGETFLDAATALVPRALWRGKPEIAGGSEFVNRFTGQVRPEEDTTSIGLPYQFELYANGGPWLVVVGLFVIGFVSARCELRLFNEFASLGRLLALAVATLVICDGGQRMNITIPSLVAGCLSAFAIGRAIEYLFPSLALRMLGAKERPVIARHGLLHSVPKT